MLRNCTERRNKLVEWKKRGGEGKGHKKNEISRGGRGKQDDLKGGVRKGLFGGAFTMLPERTTGMESGRNKITLNLANTSTCWHQERRDGVEERKETRTQSKLQREKNCSTGEAGGKKKSWGN